MEVIKLNLIPGKACPVVHASQFDDGRDFKAELYEGVNVYTLDGTETLTAIIKKPDGNEVTAAVTNTSDNYVIITTTEQMTACSGGNLGTLRIEKGAVTIATLNFILECQASPDTGIQSDSEIHNLEAQVNQMVEDAVAEQYDSNNVLFDTAPTSGHGVPYAVTSGGLWSWMRDLPLRAYPTASGSIATFDTSLALPLQDCTIAINAVQESGTPTPQDSKAISGFTGANIYQNGENLWASGDVTFTGNTKEVNISLNPNTYYISAIITTNDTDANTCSLVVYYTDSTYLAVSNLPRNTRFLASFTATKTVEKIALYSSDNYAHGAGDTATWANIVLCDTAPTTTAITWNDEAGTVYGGSLKIANGFTNLIDNKNYVDLGSLSWNNASGNLSSSSGIASDVKAPSANTQAFNGLCSCYVVAPRTGISDKQISVQTNGNIVISDTAIAGMTGEQVKAYVNGFILVYEVATPTEHTLASTPPIYTLNGTNNIFGDTNGDTSVVYACSLKDYIDSQ